MDIARPSQAAAKKRRRIILGAAGLGAVLLITLGLSRLKPAAPSVERATVWIDTVKRGPMLRQVRGLGTLVPEEIRWIPAQTEGRVERLVLLPGTAVKPDTVILELSNPELELLASDADQALRAAQASYTELKVRLESQLLDQTAAAARVKADFHQARMRADADEQLAKNGLIADITMKLSQVTAEELDNRDELEQKRLAIAGEAIEAQLAVQQAQVEQRRAPARLRRRQVQALKRQGGHGRHPAAAPRRGGPARHPRHEPRAGRPARAAEGGGDGSRRPRPRTSRSARRRASTRATASSRRTSLRVDPAVAERHRDRRRRPRRRAAQGRAPRPLRGRHHRAGAPRPTCSSWAGPHRDRRTAWSASSGSEREEAEATRVKVKLGRSSVNTVEIVEGLKEGDQVILSDTSAWDAFDRIRLN